MMNQWQEVAVRVEEKCLIRVARPGRERGGGTGRKRRLGRTIKYHINWDSLDMQPHDLGHLYDDITVEEIKSAIMSAPSQKAPGPTVTLVVSLRQHGISSITIW